MEYKKYKGIIPDDDTLRKWYFTRKRSEHEFLSFGNFKFSGIRTTENFKSDRIFFYLALFCEIGFLVAVSIMVGGFDWLLSLSAIACVVLDFIGAFLRHRKEDEICKAQLRLNVEKYKLILQRSSTDNVNIKKDFLLQIKNNASRKFGSALIILSTMLKILGSAILFELPVFTIALTFIYCFVAWIHIYKTGFYIAGKRFFNAMNKELARHINQGINDQIQSFGEENHFTRTLVENIPTNVTLKQIKMRIFSNTNIFDSLIFENGSWFYRIWNHHRIDDADLQNFINSKDDTFEVLTDNAKAFIAADISDRFFLQ